MRRMTVSQRVNEMYRIEREREILRTFNTITRAEVLFMLEKFVNLGIITVRETETKVIVQLHRSSSSFRFDEILNELDRVCINRRNRYNSFGHLDMSIFSIEDTNIQIKECSCL